MRLRQFNHNLCRLLVAGLCLVVAAGTSLAQDSVAPVDYVSTEPVRSGATTNGIPNASGVRKDSLRLLEEQLSRVLQRIAPSHEGDPVKAPRVPILSTPAPTRKERDDADLRKNWMFMTTEDATRLPTVEEALNIPERDETGAEKPRTTALERYYYETLLGPSGSGSSREDRLDPGSRNGEKKDERAGDDANLPQSVLQAEQSLRKLLGGNPFSGTATLPTRGGMADSSFGSDNPAQGWTPTRSRPENPLVRQFNDMYQDPIQAQYQGFNRGLQGLQLNQPGATVPGLSPALNNAAAPTRSPASGLAPGDINSAFAPSATPDLTSQVLNQWNPLYEPPKTEVPRPTPARPLQVEPGRRRF